MSTPEQRAEWRRLEQAATPGEWSTEIEEYGNSGSIVIPEIERSLHDTEWADPEDFQRDQDNANFIAASRTAVPSLLDDVERLEAEAGTPSDDYWDAHAYHCGNCYRALLTRGGRSKSVSPLSDPGQSEDEALCGSCAGADLYRVEAELDAALNRIAELEAALRECLPQAEFYVKMLAAQKGHYPECTCEPCIGVQVKFAKFKQALEAK